MPKGSRLVLVLLFAFVLVRTAWVCDDAYITFRTVDMLYQGHGLRWNAAERVQAYTHPLWMAALAGTFALTRECHFSSMALGGVLAMAAFLLLARSPATGALPALALAVTSKALVDFSTSGLENPLLHVLLAIFFVRVLRPTAAASDLRALALLASLIGLTRLDALLLCGPALAVAAWPHRGWPAVRALALGAMPLLAWEAFSIVYYGVPFPNTAYAKLATGLPALELTRQGLAYLGNSLAWDPFTLLATAGLVAWALTSRRPAPIAAAAGILLHLAYVVRAGGDFMSGRFLAAPFWVSLVLLAQAELPRRAALASAAVVIAGSLALPRAPLLAGSDYHHRERDHGIADERGAYYPHTGLLARGRAFGPPDHPRILQGIRLRGMEPQIVVLTTVGFAPYYAGPRVHVVDRLALADPLLARIPADASDGWRIGHFERTLPAGYLESLQTGRNRIEDPRLSALFEDVRLVTRAPLWSAARWEAIGRLNLGPLNLLGSPPTR